MNILFTGGSSFTGMWFVKELANAGHRVVAPLLHSRKEYAGLRRQRIEILEKHAKICEECFFGGERFLEIIASEQRWDVLCHHAADVTDYKSSSFDYLRAVANNTHHLPLVIEALQKKGCRKIILTGSVFEQREGTGSDELRAVSPYGLSKGLTSDIFSYWCAIKQIKLGKFVIPNPFGPYEEERFTAFLMKKWLAGEVAKISHPAYVRDNIHVSLLAKAYAQFVAVTLPSPGFEKSSPSQYTGSQAEFTQRFAKQIRLRIPYACEWELMEQLEFTEPQERINIDRLDSNLLKWNESEAWDQLVEFYLFKSQEPIQNL